MESTIFREDGTVKSAREIEQITFLDALERNPHLIDSLDRTIVTTLGPPGTCSEQAARQYLGDKPGVVRLYDSFEEAAERVNQRQADYVVIPSAYGNLNKIIFGHLGEVEVIDTFTMDTPNLVLAVKDAQNIDKVATHHAPSSLVSRYFPEAEKVFTSSNSQSAIALMEGRVDACLTTIIAANRYDLKIIEDCGPVPMGWNVLARRGYE